MFGLDLLGWVISSVCFRLLVKRFKQFAAFQIGELVQMKISDLTEELVNGTVNGTPAAAFLANTAGVECIDGKSYPGVITNVNLDACRLEISLDPWLLKGVKQRVEGGLASDAMQVSHFP